MLYCLSGTVFLANLGHHVNTLTSSESALKSHLFEQAILLTLCVCVCACVRACVRACVWTAFVRLVMGHVLQFPIITHKSVHYYYY